jgi:D-beta-D-heptose 7-phosphate kinase/D-beta-D-heptose 1-phosphate adenosyltransferase
MSEREAVWLEDLRENDGRLEAPGVSGFVSIPIGRTIVANGCFDMLHPGHLSLFGWLDTVAYKEGLRPIIAMNSDASVRRLKGPERPKWNQTARSAFLTHMKWPFTVIIFGEDTPQRLMDLLKPVMVVKGSDYPKESVVRWKDSEVVSIPILDGWSTSRMLGDTR